jgi:hypothetical protein
MMNEWFIFLRINKISVLDIDWSTWISTNSIIAIGLFLNKLIYETAYFKIHDFREKK